MRGRLLERRTAADRLSRGDAEQRGTKIKKKLEVDPIHAETVRRIFWLALDDDP